MRVWMQVVKGETVKYISHLDFQRTMQRAIRRSGIPIEYSLGFNPHGRIAFASALAVGVTSDGEYIDLILKDKVDLYSLKEDLNTKLPEGIRIADLVEVDSKQPSLMAIVNIAVYDIKCHFERTLETDTINHQLNMFLERDSIDIIKRTKKGKKRMDLRPLIYSIECQEIDKNQTVLHMVLKSGSDGSIKPEQVIFAIDEYTTLDIRKDFVRTHRIGLFVNDGDRIITPFEFLSIDN